MICIGWRNDMRDILAKLGVESSSALQFKREDVDLALCGLLFFDPTGGNPNPVLSLVRYSIVIYLVVKYARDAVRLPIPLALLAAFSVVMGCVTYFNSGSLSQSCAGMRFGMQIIASYLVFIHAVERDGFSRVLLLLAMFFLVALLVNDILMIALPYDRADATVLYLLGSKFTVSYGHAFLFCVLVAIVHSHRALMLCMGALCALMSYLAGSMTGLIVVIVAVLLSYTPKRSRKLLSKPLVVVMAVVLVNFLVWGPIDLFSNPLTQSFIVNILGKSANMTGRIPIYNMTMQFVAEKPLFGWGFQTDIYREVLGFGNAQNGVFHMLTQCGLVGTALYFSGLLLSFGRGIEDRSRCFGLYSFLLAMAVASVVEITLSSQFAFCVSLISAAELSMSHEAHVPMNPAKLDDSAFDGAVMKGSPE